MKYYFMAVPVVVLLAAAVYIFFVYDPNPAKQSSNEAPVTREETKQALPEAGTGTDTEVVELKIAPETNPSAEQVAVEAMSNDASANDASANEESQVEAGIAEGESTDKFALSDETASIEKFLTSADDNITAVTIDETTEETTFSVATDEPEEELAPSPAVEDSTDEPSTSTVVEESIEETAVAVAEEELIEDALTDDTPAKIISYVETDSLAIPQSVDPVDEDSGEAARRFEEKQSTNETAAQAEEQPPQKNVVEEPQQLSGGYIEYQAVITSSLSQATSDAGLNANQSVRVGRVFKPYLNSNRELRKGDKLTIVLDPAAAKSSGNDADQIHRIEYQGERKTLVATRKEGSLSDYEVRDADGKKLSGKDSPTSMAVEQPRREAPVAPAPVVKNPVRELPVEPSPAVRQPVHETPVKPTPYIAADNIAATGDIKRVEGVVDVTIFSAAREAGLDTGQIKELEVILSPHMNFNNDVRKGDRIAVTLSGNDIQSSEYDGAVKKLTVARGSDGAYRVLEPGDGGVSGVSSETQSGDASSSRKPPFWKRWFGFGSSSDGDANN